MRISPLAVLGAVLLYFQAVLTQSMDISLPPEDLDSSGDDYELFSGSGAGPSTEYPVVALNIPLQGSANTSLKPEVSTDLRVTQPKVEVTNSPVEDYSRVLLSTASIPVFQTNDLESSKPADDYESETTMPSFVTTGLPIMHNATSHTASTVKIIEHNYHNTYSVSSVDKTSAFDMPTSRRNLNPTRSSTVFSTVQTDDSPVFDIGTLPSEDGSGGQEDFTFSQIEENPINVDPDTDEVSIDAKAKDAKSEGAPQGIMDRKEVLGGVIAGGLVGLLFAGFLVGFMLYRMKKKDEGSYSLDEPKQSNGGYQKPHKQEEFYA